MTQPESAPGEPKLTVRGRIQEWMSLNSDVLTLSGAMMVFSLAMQMTTRFIPEYLSLLGASSFIVGFYGTFKEIVNSLYPYPGGVISDRLGTRFTLSLFGGLTTLGFLLWAGIPLLGRVHVAQWTIPSWVWVYAALPFVLGWKELGIGATFALVKDAVTPARLARGFASTELFRRIGFLLGPLLASGALWWFNEFLTGFQFILIVASLIGCIATIVQGFGYTVARDSMRSKDDQPGLQNFLARIYDDLRSLPDSLQSLLVADTCVRFANGMVYVFFILVVTRYHGVGLSLPGIDLQPESLFGVLLATEMTVALLTMIPMSRLADLVGLKWVVCGGFFVYSVFPLLLITSPESPWALLILFAFSGLRFAGLPAHKASIVSPARQGKGGATTGAYYMVRNTVRTPAPALGGLLYGWSPTVSFSLATVLGLIGTVYYLFYGKPVPADGL